MGDTVKESPLLLSVARKMNPVRLIPVTQLISAWAFYYALLHAVQAADSIFGYHKWFPVMTGDAAVVGEALIYVMLCCSALQFLTGLLELVVSCAGSHRTRWAVAFVSLVAITANHFIWAMLEGLSYPGNVIIIVFLLIIVIALGVFDMSVFVLLFLGEDKEVYGSGDPLNPFQCYP